MSNPFDHPAARHASLMVGLSEDGLTPIPLTLAEDGTILPTSTPLPASSVIAGQISEKTVPTGTAETLAAAGLVATKYILVSAPLTNSTSVYVGATGVTTSTGLELGPGDSVELPVSSPSTIYCIAATSGQKLRGVVL